MLEPKLLEDENEQVELRGQLEGDKKALSPLFNFFTC
jgi:hypothetical protein